MWLNHRWTCVDLAILGSLQKDAQNRGSCTEGKSLLHVASGTITGQRTRKDTQLWKQNFTKVSSLTWSDAILTFRRNTIKHFSRLNYCIFLLLLHLLGLHWQILELHLPFAQFYWSTFDASQYFSKKCQISLSLFLRDLSIRTCPISLPFSNGPAALYLTFWIATDSFISSWPVFFFSFSFSFITILFHNLISWLDSSERFRLLELDKLFELNSYLN